MSTQAEGRMQIAELWRYPVKSLAGERLESTDLTRNGIPGDRIVQVWSWEVSSKS